METSESRPRGSALLDRGREPAFVDEELEPDDPLGASAPPVVAVVVASSVPRLRTMAASLSAQDYPALSILIFDTTGAPDLTDVVAEVLPDAYIRRLERGTSHAEAANEAIRAVEGAPFLLLCRDDSQLEPDCISMLVTEAFRSNAAIVGPKFVDTDDARVLVDVGLSIDRYGVPYSPIEPGEVDQEQHDGVRDVFFVDDAVVLVRADLFGELDGFDPACDDSADLDLCWRARLAGARVIVAPSAVVRRSVATRSSESNPSGRVRTLLKSYSARALLWVVPFAFFLDVAAGIAALFGRRGARAKALLTAWPRVLAHVGRLRGARRDAQARRVVEDSEVRVFMIRGSARVRSFLTVRLHADDRLADASVRAATFIERSSERAHRPFVVGVAVFVVLLALGLRGFVFDGVSQIGSFVRWPSTGDLFADATSAWRERWVGSPGSGPVSLVVMGLLRALTLGNGGLARTLLIAGALPLGALGAWRLARPLSVSAYPAGAAMLAYAINPVARNALAEGRLGPLVFFALAPWLLAGLLRPAPDASERPIARWAGLGVGTAVAGAFWLPALAFLPLVGLVWLVSTALVGQRADAVRVARDAAVGTAVALVLLLPWSLRVLDAAAAGAVFRGERSFAAVLRFDTGVAGTGVLSWGLVIAAALPLIVARGERLVWASRVWFLAVAAYLLTWLPTRLWPDAHVVAAEGPLVVAALGLAMAIGIGVAAFIDQLRTFLFGWRQVAAVVAALGLALPALGFAADAWTGRYHQPSQDWAGRLGWPPVAPGVEPWRVLWIGDAQVLSDPVVDGDIATVVTRGGSADARDLWPVAAAGATELPGQLVSEARGGRTARIGRLLSSFGIRFVAVMERAAPGAPEVPVDPALVAALDDQLDLAVLQREDGLVVYENTDWAPPAAVVPEAGLLAPEAPDDVAALLAGSLARAEAVVGDGTSRADVGPGAFFLGESYDARWTADVDGESLEQAEALGWANAFDMPDRGRLSWSYPRPLLSSVWMVIGPALWVAAIVAALPGLRRIAMARARRVRRAGAGSELAP